MSKAYLKAIIHWLWIEMNLNSDDDTNEYKRLKKQLTEVVDITKIFNRKLDQEEVCLYKDVRNDFFKEIERLVNDETVFWGAKYLIGEELNIIKLFDCHLN